MKKILSCETFFNWRKVGWDKFMVIRQICQRFPPPKLPSIWYPVTEVFDSNFLSKCLTEIVSRPNFLLNFVNKFFTEEVRLTSNVPRKGKNQFDKDILAAIKVPSFRMWPLKSTENEVAAWRDCIKAVVRGRHLHKRRNMAAMKHTSTMEQSDTKEN